MAAAGTPQKEVASLVPAWKRLLWEGGHPADAFLTAASAQVGQAQAFLMQHSIQLVKNQLAVLILAKQASCLLPNAAGAL